MSNLAQKLIDSIVGLLYSYVLYAPTVKGMHERDQNIRISNTAFFYFGQSKRGSENLNVLKFDTNFRFPIFFLISIRDYGQLVFVHS